MNRLSLTPSDPRHGLSQAATRKSKFLLFARLPDGKALGD